MTAPFPGGGLPRFAGAGDVMVIGTYVAPADNVGHIGLLGSDSFRRPRSVSVGTQGLYVEAELASSLGSSGDPTFTGYKNRGGAYWGLPPLAKGDPVQLGDVLVQLRGYGLTAAVPGGGTFKTGGRILLEVAGAPVAGQSIPAIWRFMVIPTAGAAEVEALRLGPGGPSFSSLAINVTFITDAQSPYAVPSTDATIRANTAAGAIVVNLPAANALEGRILNVKRKGANLVSIVPAGADTIDGAASLQLTQDNANAQLQADGVSDWMIL